MLYFHHKGCQGQPAHGQGGQPAHGGQRGQPQPPVVAIPMLPLAPPLPIAAVPPPPPQDQIPRYCEMDFSME